MKKLNQKELNQKQNEQNQKWRKKNNKNEEYKEKYHFLREHDVPAVVSAKAKYWSWNRINDYIKENAGS